MEGKRLGDSLQIKNVRIRNRICLPPMVCYGYSGENGTVGDRNVEHYRSIARGGAGLLIQEATCVLPDGKLSADQLGLWEDSQIEGCKRIVDAVHAEGGTIFIQLHHAGVVGTSEEPLCPSAYTVTRGGMTKTGREMTEAEVKSVQEAFVKAARRAFQAGYDGVELHGCHSYLISQFLNKRVNRREDRYGENPILFVTEILEGIREELPDSFVVGIRLGGFEPGLADGIRHAKALEASGIDFIDVSYGFSEEMDAEKPEEFPYKDIIFAAGEIQKQVSVPVFAVNEIRTPEEAAGVLALTDVDMVDVGRSMLVDPDWAQKALNGEKPGYCVNCRVCQWRIDSSRCAGKILMNRRK